MSDRTKTYMWCFLLALSLRFILILLSHSKNEDIDLKIYRDTGQLVVNGVNPYDYADKVDIRQQLRTDKDNFNDWVCSDQDKWNYYASSNLPMASLFFGAIEYFFSSPKAYRYIFSFFDSLLSVIIVAFVINKWKFALPDNRFFRMIPPKIKQSLPLLVALSLGALSPVLFLWGTYVPEPKGTGLLLILSAIYFSCSENGKLNTFLSPVLLGFSVAFIGLGVFVAPLCLYYVYKNNNNDFRKILFYCFIALIACLICLLPFVPELFEMMLQRVRFAVQTEPHHGSMWCVLFKMFPNAWVMIKNIFILLFVSVNIIGFFMKRLDVAILSVNLLFLFDVIYLLNGSMDRMNIALLTLIIILGCSGLSCITSTLGIVYVIYGTFSFFCSYFYGLKESIDGIFVFAFTLLYFLMLVFQTFSKKNSRYETLSSNTRV